MTVLRESGEDMGDSAPWSARLIKDLLDLDSVEAADPADEASPVPLNGAKGAGSLARVLVQFPAVSLGALTQFVRNWVSLTGRTIEASIDGDPICIRGASKEQVDLVLAAWVARHSPSA
jgi:hypothetical protein